MEDFIASETKKIFKKAINNFAKKDRVEPTEVSILLYAKEDEGERKTAYKVCHNHEPVRECTIMEILDVRIDLKGYSMLVPPQILKIIENFENDHKSNDVELCVYLDREDTDELRYFLYVDGKYNSEFMLENVLKIEV